MRFRAPSNLANGYTSCLPQAASLLQQVSGWNSVWRMYVEDTARNSLAWCIQGTHKVLEVHTFPPGTSVQDGFLDPSLRQETKVLSPHQGLHMLKHRSTSQALQARTMTSASKVLSLSSASVFITCASCSCCTLAGTAPFCVPISGGCGFTLWSYMELLP